MPLARTTWPFALGLGLALGPAAGCQRLEEPDLPPATNAEELYSLQTFPYFYIELDDAAWDALEAEPKTYVSGRFRYLDQEFDNVGVRLKGNFTLTALSEKPSFKVKFNKFVKGTRFLGLEELVLHNMHADASMVKEALAYRAFRELGVPAPRTGYARVYLNDAFYGVYLNLEAYDDPFLAHNYDDPSGELYEGEHGDDLDHDVDLYEQDEGADTSREALQAFADMATEEGDGIYFSPDTVLDTEEFWSYMIGETIVGHFDGYHASHNYFIYHEPFADRWTWQPWSLDQAWVRSLDPFESNGYLSKKCIDLDTCREAYIPFAQQKVEDFDDLNLADDIDDILYVIDYAAHEDDRKRHSNDAMESSREAVRKFVEGRAKPLREALDCLVNGKDLDEDDDGFGACHHDCNDDDEEVFPGAVEACDGVDNDCTGYIDDSPACPCPSAEVDGTEFFFCTHGIRWTEARDFCAAQGHQLAKFDSKTQNNSVADLASMFKGGSWAIGLNDRDEEQDYRWQDDTKPSYSNWADGEPAQALDWFDCVFVSSSTGLWIERNCVEKGPFICSAKP